jgi:hypothetical protein
LSEPELVFCEVAAFVESSWCLGASVVKFFVVYCGKSHKINTLGFAKSLQAVGTKSMSLENTKESEM